MAKRDDHCPECGVFVKPENLPSHLRKAHGMVEEAARVERQRPSSRRRTTSRAIPLWMVLVVALIAVMAAGAYVAYRGSGPPTEGLPPLSEMCVRHTGLGIHNHAQLSITITGNPFAVPEGIGLISASCYRPLHTHFDDIPGRIHIELPGPRPVYLKDFFAIWGQPFSQTRILNYVADASHEIAMTVNDVPSSAYENLILQEAQRIVIEYRAR